MKKLALLWLVLALAVPADARRYEVVGPKRHAKAAVAGIIGEWVPLPPKEVAAQVAVLRRVLQDPPPTDAELIALGLQGEELDQAIVMRDNIGPDGVGRAMAESSLAALDGIRVQITRDEISISALGQDEKATYRVTRASADRVDVIMTRADGRPEPGTFVIEPDGTLVALENGEEKLRFRRAGG